MKTQGSFTYKTEHYYGSAKNIITINWRGKGEVDSAEIRKWCIQQFGNSGYREDIEDSYWVDNIDHSEIMLCKDEFLTAFLLRWA